MQRQRNQRCFKCKKLYSTAQTLRSHKKFCVDNEMYICLICGPLKTYTYQSNVLRHFKIQHPFVPTGGRRRYYKKCRIVDGQLRRTDNGGHIEETDLRVDVSELRRTWLALQRKSEYLQDYIYLELIFPYLFMSMKP